MKNCLIALRQNQALNILKYPISSTENDNKKNNETYSKTLSRSISSLVLTNSKNEANDKSKEINEYLNRKSLQYNNGWSNYNLAVCQNTLNDMDMKVNMKNGWYMINRIKMFQKDILFK
jgi:hypothetical protein